MKPLTIALHAAGLGLALGSACPDACVAHQQNDEAAVIQAGLDYMQGFLSGDADRVARGVHPELTKVIVTPVATGGQVLRYNTATTLVEAARGVGDRYAAMSGDVEVTVFHMGNGLAAARALGPNWYDFLQLARMDGQWRIVNVLWAQRDPSRPDATANREAQAQVRATALDYIEGAYTGDAERMERALHPEVTKMLLTRSQATSEPFLYKMGASDLIEGTRAGMGLLEPERRGIDVEIFDISHDMASVKVASAMYVDLLQMARVNGEWKIVTVLWVPNPDRPGARGTATFRSPAPSP